MTDYLFLMHNDANAEETNRDQDWAAYISKLQQVGAFQGGSAIGSGVCLSKSGRSPEVTPWLSG
jgi:hypothetical protein